MAKNTKQINSIDDLTPDPRNANKGTERGAVQLENSLRDYGAGRSILVDKHGVVIAGNKTLEQAAAIGMEVQTVCTDGNKLVVVQREDLDLDADPRARELAIADNRVAQTDLDWDVEELKREIDEGVDLAKFWREDELAEMLRTEPEPPEDPGAQIDKATELQEAWRTERGQLWVIPSKSVPGKEHRLLCGDSTSEADVGRVMGGEKAGAIVADPPYGMRLDADFSGMKNNLKMAQEKGLRSGRKYQNVIGDHEDFDAAPIITAYCDPIDQYWFGADYYASTLPDTQHSGAWLVWDKRLEESADKMFGSCFELCWSKRKCKREIIRIKWAGVFGTEKEPQRGRKHPNQKPVELLMNIVRRTSGTIVDPFLGSGTTMVAAEQLGRLCYGVEICEKYVAVALQRLADMGLEPRKTEAANG